jgi:hypothetical protein
VSSSPGAGATTLPYSQLLICQTPTATTFMIQGVNGQATPSLNFNIGGVNYPFPGSGGGGGLTLVVATASQSVAVSSFVSCQPTGPLTITIPAASLSAGKEIIVKDATGAAAAYGIKVTAASGQIDAATAFIICNPFGSVSMISDGTRWAVIATT